MCTLRGDIPLIAKITKNTLNNKNRDISIILPIFFTKCDILKTNL